MDDDAGDDEIQSPRSPSPYNGRISVTVAAAAPPVSPPQREPSPSAAYHVLALAAVPKTANNGREDCWSEGATAVLIDAWAERYVELSRGILKQHHWKEVADVVSSREDYIKPPKTDIQCKNRIDTVKKKYKSEKAKIDAGGGPSLWPFYHRIEQLIGLNPTSTATKPPSRKPPSRKPAGTTKTPVSGSVSGRVPTGIPVGKRSGSQRRQQPYQFGNLNRMNNGRQKVKAPLRKRGAAAMLMDSSSEEEDEEEEDEEEEEEEEEETVPFRNYGYGFPAASKKRKMEQNGGVKKEEGGGGWGDSIRMLTTSIVKLGEAYEQTEKKKLEQVVEMEKTRMKFMQEMELQRMQFFMKTQMEISQIKRRRNQSPSPAPTPPGGGIGIVAAAAVAAASSNHDDSDDELKEELSE